MMTSRAFTMIEMLVASALCAVLMVALLSVCTTMARSEQVMRNLHSAVDHAAFIDLLRRDLAQAHTVVFAANELVLTGHGGLSADSLETTHQPVRVIYRLVQGIAASQSDEVDYKGLLLREQSYPNELNNRNTWSECAGLDVRRFEVHPIGVRTFGSPGEAVDSAAFPVAVRVELEWNKPEQPALSTVIFTR